MYILTWFHKAMYETWESTQANNPEHPFHSVTIESTALSHFRTPKRTHLPEKFSKQVYTKFALESNILPKSCTLYLLNLVIAESRISSSFVTKLHLMLEKTKAPPALSFDFRRKKIHINWLPQIPWKFEKSHSRCSATSEMKQTGSITQS